MDEVLHDGVVRGSRALEEWFHESAGELVGDEDEERDDDDGHEPSSALASEDHPEYCREERDPEPRGSGGVEECVEEGAVEPVDEERQLLV